MWPVCKKYSTYETNMNTLNIELRFGARKQRNRRMWAIDNHKDDSPLVANPADRRLPCPQTLLAQGSGSIADPPARVVDATKLLEPALQLSMPRVVEWKRSP